MIFHRVFITSEGTVDYSYFNISSVRYLHTLVTIPPMIPNGNILSETNVQSKIIFLLFFISKKKVSTLKLFKLILHKISLDMIIQNDYQMIWFNPLILVLKYKIFQLLFICVKFQHIFLFWIIFLFAILTLLFMRFKNWSYIHICSDQRPIASALGPRRTITWKMSFSRISRSPCDGKITWEKLFSFKNSLLMNF